MSKTVLAVNVGSTYGFFSELNRNKKKQYAKRLIQENSGHHRLTPYERMLKKRGLYRRRWNNDD